MQSQVRFNRVPKKVPEKVWEALVQSQVRFNRVPRRFRRRFREALAQRCAEPGQVQQGSGEGSRRMGGFGAEPGQGQQGSREGSGEWEALVQGSGKPWCKAKSGPTGSEEVAEAKPGQVHLTHGNPAEVFPALGFPARSKKICKNKTFRLLGIPAKLIFSDTQHFLIIFDSRCQIVACIHCICRVGGTLDMA